MPLVALDNTITLALSVRDRHASASWYSETLGFELVHHIDEAGWSEMRTKTEGVTLGLGEQQRLGPLPVYAAWDRSRVPRRVQLLNGVSFIP